MGTALNLLSLGSRFAPIDPVYLQIRSVVAVMGIATLFLMGWRYCVRLPKSVLKKSILWFLLGSVVTLSGVANASRGGIADGMWLAIGVPLLFFVLVPKVLGEGTFRAAAGVLIVSAIPYVILSLATVPIEYPYRGILGNPNQMGILMAGVGWGLLGLIYSSYVNREDARLMAYVVLEACVFTLILFTGSRSSLISTTLAATVTFIAMVRDRPVFRARVVLMTGFMLVAVATVYLGIGWDLMIVVEGIIEKQQQKSVDGLLSGREVAWMWAFDNLTLLGHGQGAILDAVGMSSHNSFISILNDYGVIAVLLLLAIAVYGLLRAIKYYSASRVTNPGALFPLIVFVGFWTLAMTEGLFGSIGRGVTVAFFIVYGIVIVGVPKSDMYKGLFRRLLWRQRIIDNR